MMQNILLHGLLLLLVYDSLLWSVYLLRHSLWLRLHPKATGYCDRISYLMLAAASIFTGVFIAGSGLMWLWYKTMFGFNPYCFTIIIALNVNVIHLFALLAHCTSLDVCYWPTISKCISIRIVQPIKRHYFSYIKQEEEVGDYK